MAHNTSHRTEASMNRVYGGWNLKAPTTNWDKFSANHDQSGGLAGVGTCHWPANAQSDYDYGNNREVASWADDFLDYPHLDGERKPISSAAWSGDRNPHVGYMRWYFAHLPRAVGVNGDGRQNNWWKYLYDFDNYTEKGEPKPASAELRASDLFELGGSTHMFKVAYRSPVQIDMTTLGDDDLVVTGPTGFRAAASFVVASDRRSGTYRVAAYRVAAPAGAWREADRGSYAVSLQEGAVKDALGRPVAARTLGAFQIRSTSGAGNDRILGEARLGRPRRHASPVLLRRPRL
jgi:hypothetical protein